MPGAELQEVEGDEYRGIVKVKVGPITAQYKGTARFVEKNDGDHRAVLKAEGRDTRGQGTASATVTAVATPDNGGTAVSIVTELAITGKVAQFGRSIMGDISAKMLGEFADRLEADLLSEGSGPDKQEPAAEEPQATNGTSPDAADSSSVRKIHSTPAEPVDLFGTAGPSVLKRAVPPVLVVVVVLLLWSRRRHRRR
jgi:hypothetical protein